MLEINQELLDSFYDYFVETGFYQENKIWTEMLIGWVRDKYAYVEEFMIRLRELSSEKHFANSEEYNQFFQEEYEKYGLKLIDDLSDENWHAILMEKVK